MTTMAQKIEALAVLRKTAAAAQSHDEVKEVTVKLIELMVDDMTHELSAWRMAEL